MEGRAPSRPRRLNENSWVFRALLDKDELRFLIIGNNFDWSFPRTIAVKPTAKTLTRKDGSQLERGFAGIGVKTGCFTRQGGV